MLRIHSWVATNNVSSRLGTKGEEKLKKKKKNTTAPQATTIIMKNGIVRN